MANSSGWGDGAANNTVGWGQGANNAIGWGKSHSTSWAGATDIVGTLSPSFDADAQAFITAAAITNATQQTAIDNLVIGLKADGLWTNMNAIYPFVGGTATTHKYNLKDPRDLDAAYRLQFNGGITHSSNGALPNGTNGYADTFFNASILSSDSIHFSGYFRTQLGSSSDLGCEVYNNIDDQYFVSGNNLRFQTASNITYSNGALIEYVTTPNTSANYIVTRTDLLNNQIYRNGTLLESASMAGLNSNANMLLMGTRYVFLSGEIDVLTSKNQMAFATIGEGLDNTQSINLYNRIQAFQTALSRQV